MRPPTAALPIILGLSLIGISGAYLYMLLKKKRSPANGDVIDFRPRSVSKSGVVVAEITVSNKLVPLVIGRKGYTLKHIQQTTGTEITFREQDETSQLCRIQGASEEAVRRAKEMVQTELVRPVTVTEEVFVPQAACGKILGRCGDALQEICRTSMAKVWLEGRARNETERRVMITGTQAQIDVAKQLIAHKVQEDAECRKLLTERQSREPRIRTPPSSAAPTPTPGDQAPTNPPLKPVTVEKLSGPSSFGTGQMEVFVSAVVSPSKFFVQLVGPQSAELDALVDSMTEYYGQAQNRELHRIRKPYLGQIVAVEFNADNKWYRAEVSAILPNEYHAGEIVLDLYFVDYGDNQYTNPTEVYELRPDFLALRFQAIECFLAKVQPLHSNPLSNPLEDDWDTQATNRFEELAHVARWKKIVSKIVTYRKCKSSQHGRESSPVPGVELFDTASNGTDQINIAHELVAAGLAKYAANECSDELTRSQLFRLGLASGGSQSSSVDKLEDASGSSSTSAATVVSLSKQQPVSHQRVTVSHNDPPRHADAKGLTNGTH
ncbi:tudor and KH domain-containing protein homolog [Anopheles bellator]|uniref:tudor and KH domain-containing protein homolog n=1 Tax=Anopheles bellator TaxID=139047 RepID=UPI002647AD89|nr:tudor and KH domain-containing protein homolog [Anopheles bellator]